MAQQPAPVFRASTDYVRFDAIVTDAHGRPIQDLTAADFEITDSGQPQTVDNARLVSIPVQHRQLDLDQSATPQVDVATNAPPAPDSRVFVVIVDDLHLVPTTIPFVQRVMTEFIETLSPHDEAAILFVGHSNLSQNVTGDTGKLLDTVKRVRSAFGFGIGVAGQLQVEEMPYDRDVVFQIKNVAEALSHSTHARRAIVFVGAFAQISEGAAIGTTEFGQALMLQQFIDDAWAAARRADVPIYTIDPRGIPDVWNSATGQRVNAVPNTDVALNMTAPQALRNAGAKHRTAIQQDHLAEMAINTGGKFYINRPDLSAAVDEMMADNSSFYELGYYPRPAPHDGKFHEVKLSVRRPDVHVRMTKDGYVGAKATGAEAQSLTDALNTALGDGLNVSGLNLQVVAIPMAPTGKKVPTVVTLKLSYALPSGDSTSFEDDVQTTILGLDPDGKIKLSATRPWHLSGPSPSSGTVMYVVDDVIEMPAEPLTFRVGAISRLVGRAGTVQFLVDPPKTSSGRLQLGGIALGLNESLSLVMGSDTLRDVVPFQPTTTRTFSDLDRLRVYGTATWTKGEIATATVTISGGASPVVAQATVHDVKDPQGRHAGTIDATIALGGLTPGQYVLTLGVELASHEHSSRAIPISIR